MNKSDFLSAVISWNNSPGRAKESTTVYLPLTSISAIEKDTVILTRAAREAIELENGGNENKNGHN